MTATATREPVPSGTTPLRVLLVEDDEDDVLRCRTAITDSLSVGCQVNAVETLREAVACLEDEVVDLALVDLTLPDARDLEAITTLARRFTQLPIIVLTAAPDEETAIRALQAGAQDCLVKDGDPDAIGRAIRYALARKHAERVRREREAGESANRAKTAFLSRMSHELRTPLTAILGFAQLLELQAPDEEQELVRPILRAGRQLQRLIEEILDIARIDAGELSLSLEPVHVSEVLEETLALIQPLAVSREITLTVEQPPAQDLFILADRQRVSQVLLNLLSNAVKYDRDGGRVSIRCRQADGRLRIDVCDTGEGLSQDQLAALFTPFNRLDGCGITGTGLGLVITKRLVEAMGGVIGLDSTKGAGTIAWTEWTTVPDPAHWSARPHTGDLDHVVIEGVVLYIEDNFVNVSLVETLLGRYPGVRLMTVMKAHLGLELAEQHQPDVVLLDLNLPDMTGEEALAQLRAQASTRDIPVIVISADANPASEQRLRALGAHAYLTKPFKVDELVTTIADVLT